MSPRPAAKAAAPPADPLADLRDEPDAPTLPTTGTEGPTTDPEPPAVGLVTEKDQANARATLVAAWHADTVSRGFLHSGGACGCWYLSGVAVGAVLPVTPDPVDPEGD